jgi:hypothetical protein
MSFFGTAPAQSQQQISQFGQPQQMQTTIGAQNQQQQTGQQSIQDILQVFDLKN